jgi:dCMP deaminase
MTNPLDTPRLQEWALGMARHVAKLSKDPSSQVGAVIFDPKRRIVSAGYNGFARGVYDTEARLTHRETKYKLVLHAEKNAILFATGSTHGCTLIVTHPCCAQCAALIIQAGVRYVMWPRPTAEFEERWRHDLLLTWEQFNEAGVIVTEIDTCPEG